MAMHIVPVLLLVGNEYRATSQLHVGSMCDQVHDQTLCWVKILANALMGQTVHVVHWHILHFYTYFCYDVGAAAKDAAP